jgi:hypothetical protein
MHDRRRLSVTNALARTTFALLATLGIVACGSASTENVESGNAALVIAPPVRGINVCSPKSAPVPSGLGISCDSDVAAYAFSSSTGVCPNISDANGVWSSNLPETGGGLKAYWAQLWPSCGELGLDASCCMYGWVPKVANAAPDVSLLCAVGGDEPIAIPDCSICLDDGKPVTAGACPNPSPSGGGCPTCRVE